MILNLQAQPVPSPWVTETATPPVTGDGIIGEGGEQLYGEGNEAIQGE